jgi:NAD(P)-dependent dehydrogenase (short-subunit alcohol dehydrogenase family)
MSILAGKVALVTGASRGIGRGVAIGLARAGANVAVSARTMQPSDAPMIAGTDRAVPGTLAETAQAIEDCGVQALAFPADLSDGEKIRQLVETTVQKLGRIDILVNSAMGFADDFEGTKFWESPVTDFDNQNTVGVRSCYLTAYYAAPHMVAQESGLIVNISSVAAIEEFFNAGFRTAHCANARLAKAMAFDLGDHGVASLALWPRWVRTERVEMAANNDHPGLTVTKEDLDNADSPEVLGAAIANLSVDPNLMNRSGHIQLIGELAEEFALKNENGRDVKSDDYTKECRVRVDKIEDMIGW